MSKLNATQRKFAMEEVRTTSRRVKETIVDECEKKTGIRLATWNDEVDYDPVERVERTFGSFFDDEDYTEEEKLVVEECREKMIGLANRKMDTVRVYIERLNLIGKKVKDFERHLVFSDSAEVLNRLDRFVNELKRI